MADSIHIYRQTMDEWKGAERLRKSRNRLPGLDVSFWRPSITAPFPPGRRDPRIMVYTAMHLARVFLSSDYGMVSIVDEGRTIAHSSLIMPGFARFPFMDQADLQIGATFTAPQYRGQGLAVLAIDEIISRYSGKNRAFWYLTAAQNHASISVIEKAGFTLAGIGSKKPRFGLKALGFYDILN